MTVTELQAQGVERDGTELTKDRVDLEAKRVSALEGSREAVSKFQAAFQQTTKIDEITSSLNQLKTTITDLDSQETKDFFKTFDQEPIALIFTKEEIEKIKKGGKDAKDIFNDTVEEFNNLRTSIANSKDKLALLNAEAKKYNFASKVGGESATLLAQKQTEIAEQQRDIAKNEMIAALRSQGISETETEILAKKTTEKEIRAAALAMGKDEIAIQKIVNEFLKSQNADLEYQFTLNTENARAKQAQATADQKINAIAKEAIKIEEQKLLIQAKQKAFRETGTTEVRGKDSFKLELETARESLRIAKDEAEVKKALIEAEFILLRERLKLIEMDEDARKKLLNNINTAETNAKNNVDNAITNMENNIGVKVMDGFKKGLDEVKSGDFLSGLSTSIAAAGAAEGEGGTSVTTAENINLAKVALEGYKESLMALGPEGEAVAAFAGGALQIADSFNTFTTSMDKADKLKAVGNIIGGISQMMAANSKAQIAEIDNQIEAEKRRDGKSKESMAKIAAMEKKKVAMQKKAFEQNKKMKMAETVINTASAIVAVLPNVFLAAMIGAMGAAQLAIIQKSQFQGGASQVEEPRNTALNIGKRDNAVDTSKRATAGELAFLRGARGVGTNANNFTPGGAMGRKGYANGGDGIVVGERGPEIITPSSPVDITPNFAMGGGETNVNFNISAVDGASVQNMLNEQQGNIIAMIRQAANDNGEGFLETVDPTVYGGGG